MLPSMVVANNIHLNSNSPAHAQETLRQAPSLTRCLAILEQNGALARQMAEIPPETLAPRRVIPIDIRMAAHILGDSIIQNTELEGHMLEKTSQMMIRLLEDNEEIEPGVKNRITSELEGLASNSKAIGALISQLRNASEKEANIKIIQLAKGLEKKVNALKPGESLLLDGGWKNAGKPGHAMVYKITRNERGNLDLLVLNTGAGLNYHTNAKGARKLKSHPVLNFSGIPDEKFDSYLFQKLLEPHIVPFTDLADTGRMAAYNENTIYKTIDSAFRKYRAPTTQHLVGLITPQRSGTCAWQVLMKALIHSYLPRDKYKLTALDIHYQTLLQCYQQYHKTWNQDTKQMAQIRTIVSFGLENAANGAAKLFTPNDPSSLLSAQKAKEMAGGIKTIRQSLAAAEEAIKTRQNTRSLRWKGGEKREKRLALLTKAASKVKTDGNVSPPDKLPAWVDAPRAAILQNQLPAALQEAEKHAKTLIIEGHYREAEAFIDQLVSKIPVPKSTSDPYYETLPADVLQKLTSLLGLYSKALIYQHKSGVFPSQGNTILTLLAGVDKLARVIDRGQILKDPLFYPGTFLEEDSLFVYFHPKDFEKRKEIKAYFDHQGKLFDFSSQALSGNLNRYEFEDLKKGSSPFDLKFYERLAEQSGKADLIARLSKKVFGLKFQDLNVHLQAALLLWGDFGQISDGFLKDAYPHLLCLKQAALMAHVFASHRSSTTPSTQDLFSQCQLELYEKNLTANFNVLGLLPGWIKWGSSLLTSGVFFPKTTVLERFISERNGLNNDNNEGEVLTKPKSYPAIREKEQQDFLRVSCDPDLNPLQLVHFFRNHIDLLNDSGYQAAFDITFFKTVNDRYPVLEKIEEEPALSSETAELIAQGINFHYHLQPAKKPHLEACLFLTRLAENINLIRVKKGLSPRPFPEVDRMLADFEKRNDFTPQERGSIALHRLYLLRHLSELTPEQEEKMVADWCLFHYLGSELYNPPYLRAAIEEDVYERITPLLQRMEEAGLTRIGQAVLQAAGLTHSSEMQWVMPKPTVIRANFPNGDFREIHLAQGALYSNEGRLSCTASLPIQNTIEYQNVFENRRYIFNKAGNTYYFSDPKWGDFRFVGSVSMASLQKKIGGSWWQYLTPQECDCFDLPNFCLAEHHHFVPVDKQKALAILDRQEMKVNWKVDESGRLLQEESEVFNGDNLKEFSLMDLPAYIRVDYTLDGRRKGISYPRYHGVTHRPLAFDATPEGALVWSENCQYTLEENPPEGLLGHIPNYLLLRHCEHKHQRKLLVPFQKIIDTADCTPFASLDTADKERKKNKNYQEFLEKQSGNYHYFVFDLNQNGEVSSTDVEGRLFLAYLALQERRYEQADGYLKSIEPGDELSERAFEIVAAIHSLDETNHDSGPNATAVRLKALLLKNRYLQSQGKSPENLSSLYDHYLNLIGNVTHALRLTDEEELEIAGTDSKRKEEVITGNSFTGKSIVEQPLKQRAHLNYPRIKSAPKTYAFNYSAQMPLEISAGQDYPYLLTQPASLSSLSQAQFFFQAYLIAKKGTEEQKKALTCHLDHLCTLQGRDWVYFLLAALRYPDTMPDHPYVQCSDEVYDDFVKQVYVGYQKAEALDRLVQREEQALPAVSEPLPFTTSLLADAPEEIRVIQPSNVLPLLETETAPFSLGALAAKYFTESPAPAEGDASFEVHVDLSEDNLYRNAILGDLKTFTKDFEAGKKERQAEARYTLSSVENLKQELNQLLQAYPLDETQKILKLANCTPENEEGKVYARLKKRQTLKMQDLIYLFVKGDKEAYQKANPYLNDEAVTLLHTLTCSYLQQQTERQQIARALKLCAKIEKAKEKDTLIQDLAEELQKSRKFDVAAHPELLALEYYGDISIKEKQVALINKLLETDASGRYIDRVIQLIMGGGKTSVLAAILGIKAARRGRLSLFITPASQFETVKQNLKRTQKRCFNQRIQSIDVKREDLTPNRLTAIHQQLDQSIKKGSMLVMKSETVQGLELEFLCLVKKYKTSVQKSQEDTQKIEELRAILLILREQCDALIDEIDLVLSVLLEVNYPLGEASRIRPERIALIKEIYQRLAQEPLKGIVRLQENKQAFLTPKQYQEEVVPKLAESLAKEVEALHLPEEHRASYLRYVAKKIPIKVQHAFDGKLSEESLSQDEAQDLAFLKYVHTLRNSLSEQENEAAHLIALSKFLFTTLLPHTLAKSGGRHYGRARQGIPGKICPYLAVDTPAATEFGFHYEAIAFHFQTALQFGIGKEQLRAVGRQMTAAANYYSKKEGEVFDATVEARQYEEMTGIPLSRFETEENLEKALQKLQQNPHLTLDLEAESAQAAVTYHQEFVTGTGHSLVDEIDTSRGMSGTPWNYLTYAKKLADHFLPDLGTEGKIAYEMVKRAAKETVAHVIEDNQIESVIGNTFDASRAKGELRGLMDPGGVFTGVPNEKIARMILQKLKDTKIDTVVFFYRQEGKETPDQVAFIRLNKTTGAISPPEIVEGTRAEELEAKGVKPEEYFVFYDERHCTGTDIKQIEGAINVVTFDVKMLKRTLFQAVMRLRQYFSSQDVELILSKAVLEGLTPIESEGSEREFLVKQAIVTAIVNEAVQKSKDILRSYKQRIDNAFRRTSLNALLKSTTVEEMTACLTKYETFLFSHTEDCPYEQFGRIEEEIETFTELENYAARRHAAFLRLGNITISESEHMKTSLSDIVDEARQDPNLPQKTVSPIGDQKTGMEMNIAVEVRKEVTKNVDMALEDELQQELQRYNSLPILSVYWESAWDEGRAKKFLMDWDKGMPLPETFSLPIVFKLTQSRFASSPPYGSIFRQPIFATRNFTYTCNTPLPVFHYAQRPAHQILVKRVNGQYQAQLLSEKEAAFFEGFLRKNPECQRNTWLIQPDGSVLVTNPHERFPAEEKAVGDLLLEINAFNGNAEYLDRHPLESLAWLNAPLTSEEVNIRAADLRTRFLKLKVEKNEKQKEILYQSVLLPDCKEAFTRRQVINFSRQKKRTAAIDPKEIQSIISPILIQQFDEYQVRYAAPSQVQHLLPHQIGWLVKEEQLREVPPEILDDAVTVIQCQNGLVPVGLMRHLKDKAKIQAIPGLKFEALTEGDLDESQIRALSPHQIKHLKDPALIGLLGKEQLPFITTAQIQSLKEEKAIALLQEAQLKLLTEAQIQSLRSVDLIKRLNDAQLKQLTRSQIEALTDPELIGKMPEKLGLVQIDINLLHSFLSSHPQYLKTLRPDQINQYHRIADYLDDLEQNQIHCLNDLRVKEVKVDQLNYLSNAQLQSLSLQQIQSITEAPLLLRLSENQIQQITESQVRSLKSEEVMLKLSDEQLAFLSPMQLLCIRRDTLQKRIPPERFQEALSQIRDSETINKLPQSQLINLSDAQIGMLTSQFLIQKLLKDRPEKVALVTADINFVMNRSLYPYLNPRQVNAIQDDNVLKELPSAQLRNLTEKRIAQISNSDLFPQLTREQLGYLRENQVRMIADHRVIDWLTTKQLEYLTPSQVAAITDPYIMLRLPLSQIRHVTQFPEDFLVRHSELNQGQSPKHLGDAQIKKLTRPILINGLDVNQTGALESDQIPSLTEERLIAALSPKQIADLTPPQIVKITSPYLLKRLASAQFSLLTAAQIQSQLDETVMERFSDTQLRLLKKEQVANLQQIKIIERLSQGLLDHVQADRIPQITDIAALQRLSPAKVKCVSAGQVKSLTTDQIQYLKSKETIQAVPVTQVHCLYKQQFTHCTAWQKTAYAIRVVAITVFASLFILAAYALRHRSAHCATAWQSYSAQFRPFYNPPDIPIGA